MTNLNDSEFISKLNNHLKSGGVIAFPTDTVWGLGALPTRVGADALFEIKRRPANKHLIIMSDNLEHIRPYMSEYPARAFELAQKYWPGALTIGVPVAGTDSMVFGGVRVPNYKPFMELCGEHGISINKLATISALPPSSIKNILYGKSQNPKLITIKMICDGLDITLGEFFSTPEFDSLEQELK